VKSVKHFKGGASYKSLGTYGLVSEKRRKINYQPTNLNSSHVRNSSRAS
jgi:hypothetical protein